MDIGPLEEMSDDDLEYLSSIDVKPATWWQMGSFEYRHLNPPVQTMLIGNDVSYMSMICDEKWQYVGHIPTPKTKIGWFAYHLVHGLVMRYRLLPVIIFSFKEAFLQIDSGDVPDSGNE